MIENKKEMYGLFLNTYDYHEWHNLVRVSADKEALEKSVEGEKIQILYWIEQEFAKEKERTHYVIEEIEEI